MKYDFTKLADRRGQGSAKWQDMYQKNPKVESYVVPLSVADMEFEHPKEITEGLKSYLDHAVLGYTIPTEAYYEAVCNWMRRRHNWEITAESIVCAPGVVPALYTSVEAFTKPGDEVLLLTPVYYPFYAAVERLGRKVITSSLLEEDCYYTMNFSDIEEKLAREEVKLLLFSNPHNPVGRVWTVEELKKLGDLCKKYGVLVVSDEIHQDLIMPGYVHTVFQTVDESFADFSVVCTAPSKTFNLAGMQTSNIIIPNPQLREEFSECIQRKGGGPFLNILGYEACKIAYNQCESWLEELLTIISQNSQLVKRFFEENLPQAKVGTLEGTYLQWVDLRALTTDYKKLEHLHIHEAQAFFDEGYIFGTEGEGFIRINLACPSWVIRDALERLYQTYRANKLI